MRKGIIAKTLSSGKSPRQVPNTRVTNLRIQVPRIYLILSLYSKAQSRTTPRIWYSRQAILVTSRAQICSICISHHETWSISTPLQGMLVQEMDLKMENPNSSTSVEVQTIQQDLWYSILRTYLGALTLRRPTISRTWLDWASSQWLPMEREPRISLEGVVLSPVDLMENL